MSHKQIINTTFSVKEEKIKKERTDFCFYREQIGTNSKQLEKK